MNIFKIASNSRNQIHEVFKKTLKISFVTILLFSINTAYCQNDVLVLTKNSTGKEKTINQGKKIKIWTNTGETYRGAFSLKADSVVIQDKCCIALNDIVAISTKHAGSYLLGGAVTGSGLIFSALAGTLIALIVDAGGFAYYGMILAAPIALGAILVTTTGVLIFAHGAKHKSSSWSYGTIAIDPKV